jgi:diguanylate cyclase (GGDEF)-like protein
MVGISRDVTVEQRIEEDRKRLQDRMAYIAYHDPLTGLENRFGLGACLRQAASQSVPFALLYLDLNQFKHVNDTMGHQAGDVLLRHVARRLETCIRDKDTVARHGGDEFVVIQMGADCERDAAHLAQRVIAGVGEPCGIHGHIVKIGVSIGITLVTDHSRHADEILKDADIALYRAKHAGRGCYCFSNADHPNGTNHLKWADFGMNREKTEAEPFWNREKGQSTKSS